MANNTGLYFDACTETGGVRAPYQHTLVTASALSAFRESATSPLDPASVDVRKPSERESHSSSMRGEHVTLPLCAAARARRPQL